MQHALLHDEEIMKLVLRVDVPCFEDLLLELIQIEREHRWQRGVERLIEAQVEGCWCTGSAEPVRREASTISGPPSAGAKQRVGELRGEGGDAVPAGAVPLHGDLIDWRSTPGGVQPAHPC